MNTEQMIVGLLNEHVSSRLRVEIKRVETTQSSGQANLTDLIDIVRARLSELEPGSTTLPDENRWDQGGMVVYWTARERSAGEDAAPVAYAAGA